MSYTSLVGSHTPSIQTRTTQQPINCQSSVDMNQSPVNTDNTYHPNTLCQKICFHCSHVFVRLAGAAMCGVVGVMIYKSLSDKPNLGITILACFIIGGLSCIICAAYPYIPRKTYIVVSVSLPSSPSSTDFV